MISNALRVDIEGWVAQRGRNPVLRMAELGTLTVAMITRYIASVTHMIRLTPGHLLVARDRARADENEALAAHYQHKYEEEVGHDVWGERDLESLTRLVSAPSNTTAPPAVEELASYVTQIIAEDPALYLGYIAFSEYITVLLGPELLTNVEQKCGIPKSALSIIGNHVEVDVEHVEENFGVIDDLVGDPRKIGPMRKALAGVVARYDALCAEVTSIPEAHHAPAAPASVRVLVA